MRRFEVPLLLVVVLMGVLGAPREDRAAFAQVLDGPEGEEQPEGARIELFEVRDRVEADGTMVRRQRNRALLVDAAGVARFSQVGVPFMEANQEAELTELLVTKPDGTVLDLLASAPRDVAPVYPPEMPIYSDLRLLRAAVPSLEAGDRISFETLVRVRPLAPGVVWTEMKFAAADLVGDQTYELDLPEDSALVVHARAGLGSAFEEEVAGGRRVRRWRVAGASAGASAEGEEAALEDEPKGDEADVVATSFRSWDELGAWWATLAPPEVDDVVRAKAAELTEGISEPRAKLSAIHRFVAQKIRYLSLPLGLGRYRARPPAEVLRTGLGDCKDKIRLLASLAESVGLAVDPVLVGVERRRRIDAAPSPDQFDHVVARARIDGAEIWMDPTSEMTAMGSLPPLTRDLPGLAMAHRGKGWVAEPVSTPARPEVEPSVEVTTTGSIDRSGTIRARVRWTFRGDAELVRMAYRYGNAAQLEAAAEAFGRDWKKGERISGASNGDPSDLDSPFWIEYQAEWRMKSSVWAEDWTLWLPVPRLELDAAPDAEEDPAVARRPLALTAPRRQRVSARLELPEGVEVTSPVPVTTQREFASYASTYRVEGRVLSLERELRILVDEVAPNQFVELEAFRERMSDDRGQEFDIAAAPQVAPPEAETADSLGHACHEALEQDRNEEAEKLCRRAIELESSHRYAWNNLGRALKELGRLEEAEAAHRRQLEIAPDDAWSWANLGRIAWDRGDVAEAERLLRKQIDVAPLEAFAYRQLGYLLAQQNKLQEAAELYTRALKLDPEDEWTRTSLQAIRRTTASCGELLAELGSSTQSGGSFKEKVGQATILVHRNCRPLSPLAGWFDALGREAQVALAGLKVGDLDADDMSTFGGLAISWQAAASIALEQGDAGRAELYTRSVLALAPSATVASQRADALSALGRGDEAAIHLALAVALAGPSNTAEKKRFEAEVEASRWPTLTARAVEDSWRLRSSAHEIPGAAGASAVVFLLFSPDGLLQSVRALDEKAPRALIEGLSSERPSIPVPPGNRAFVPRRAQASCNAAGLCTLVYEHPYQTAYFLIAGD